jgi:hypothetical protein
MIRHPALLALCIAPSLLIFGCGDDAPATVAPELRCASDDLALVGQGTLEGVDGAANGVKLEVKTTDSGMEGPQAYLRLSGYKPGGDADARPLIVRLYAGGSGGLLTRIDRAAEGQPLDLTVVDATDIPAGNVSPTALDRYTCNLEMGSICVQVGEDSNNNGVLDDQDARVFNASAGSDKIEALDVDKRRMRLSYNVTLGRNIIDLRSMSSNTLAGCLDATYEAVGESGWSLK